MKFLVQPTTETLGRARPPVRAFLLFATMLVVASMVQRGVQGGLSPAGLEQLFADAPGWGSTTLWEEVHSGAFVYGFLLLTLGSLLAVCPVSGRLRDGLVLGGLGAALADLLLPFLAFRLPGWAALRVVSFLLASSVLLVSIATAWLTFGKPVRRA